MNFVKSAYHKFFICRFTVIFAQLKRTGHKIYDRFTAEIKFKIQIR